MNDDPLQKHLTAFSMSERLADLKKLARREPAKAVAISVGVGLLIRVMPARVVLGAVTAVFAAFIRPALLSLGVVKATELCCKNHQIPSNP
jgi:hypothetical protein